MVYKVAFTAFTRVEQEGVRKNIVAHGQFI